MEWVDPSLVNNLTQGASRQQWVRYLTWPTSIEVTGADQVRRGRDGGMKGKRGAITVKESSARRQRWLPEAPKPAARIASAVDASQLSHANHHLQQTSPSSPSSTTLAIPFTPSRYSSNNFLLR